MTWTSSAGQSGGTVRVKDRLVKKLEDYRPSRRRGATTSPHAFDPVRGVPAARPSRPAAGVRADDGVYPVLRGPVPVVMTAAAVLVPIILHGDEITVLLTQRAAHLPDHASQISFPGGRIEAADARPEDAALREAEEEVGLARAGVEVIGRLDLYETGTGFSITPVVGLIAPPVSLTPDPLEVADIFEVPLSFVTDPRNHKRHSAIFNGVERHFWALPFEDRYIWGATAGMLVNLSEVLNGD